MTPNVALDLGLILEFTIIISFYFSELVNISVALI